LADADAHQLHGLGRAHAHPAASPHAVGSHERRGLRRA
jgi:hypothetical protein